MFGCVRVGGRGGGWAPGGGGGGGGGGDTEFLLTEPTLRAFGAHWTLNVGFSELTGSTAVAAISQVHWSAVMVEDNISNNAPLSLINKHLYNVISVL